jgi:hypothetical protein
MSNKYDALKWLKKIYDSLNEAEQIPIFYKLINNYTRQFDIEFGDPIFWELEKMKLMHKFKIIN